MTDRERLEIAWRRSLEMARQQDHGDWYSDDTIDYMRAAFENAAKLTAWVQDWNWVEGGAVNRFAAWLAEPTDDWGASDGEIRFGLAEDDPTTWPELAASVLAWDKKWEGR